MFELVRNAEGEITRAEFRKGAALVLGATVLLVLLVRFVTSLSYSMEWMTVAVAPFLGGVLLLTSMSIVYFWYCLFAKRLRKMAQGKGLLGGWLAALVVAGASRLVHYQNTTLGLADSGPIAQAGAISVLAIFCAALFFFILLGICWFGPDARVPPGSCLTVPDNKGNGEGNGQGSA